MATDKIRKYVLPNIPYLFICWFCLKIGTAYRLAAGADFGEKLLGLGQTIGAAFASFAPGLAPLDWLVGIVGAAGFRLRFSPSCTLKRLYYWALSRFFERRTPMLHLFAT